VSSDPHRSVREQLGGYVLGQLADADAVALRAHVDGCAACQGELAELAPLAVALRDVDPARLGAPASPAPDLGDRIVALVRRSQRTERRRRGRRLGVTSALAAAAAVAAFVAGATLGVPGGGDPAGPAAPAAAPPVEDVELGTVAEGVRAEAGLVTHTWGTEVQIVATGLEDGGTYRVTFLRDDGTRVPAGTFLGTGEDAVRCSLNGALPRASAAAVVVTDAVGAVVLEADTA
jgi:hypothetical protein